MRLKQGDQRKHIYARHFQSITREESYLACIMVRALLKTNYDKDDFIEMYKKKWIYENVVLIN